MLNKDFSIEIIIAAYNQAEYTKLVLDGYLLQQDMNFSIAIADDGSGQEISDLVNAYIDKGLSIRHEWQEDKGFRKAKIVNHTIATSKADYLILTDNDCIPHPDFVGSHRRRAKRGYFTVGRRINLRAKLSQGLVSGKIPLSKTSNRGWLIYNSLKRELNYAEFGLRFPWIISSIWSKKDVAMFGANFAVWREDILGINGFDSEFIGYGMADTDVEWRLMALGIKRQALLGRGCVVHLYHKTRSQTKRNTDVMVKRKQDGIIFVNNGIIKKDS